jgi:hypothetical protein
MKQMNQNLLKKQKDSIAKQEVCIAKQEDNIQLYE